MVLLIPSRAGVILGTGKQGVGIHTVVDNSTVLSQGDALERSEPREEH